MCASVLSVEYTRTIATYLWGYWKNVFIFRSSEPNSGVTISKVVELLCPIMCFYENVKGAIERTTDANGKKHPPAIQSVEKDANEKGYHFAPGLMICFPPSSESSSLSSLSSSSSPSLNTCMSLLAWCSHHGIHIYIYMYIQKAPVYIYIYMYFVKYIYIYNVKCPAHTHTDIYIYIYTCIIVWQICVENTSAVTQVWSLLDSQDFLARHRRNRVWGVAAVNSGQQSEDEFQTLYKSAILSLKTHCHFSMRDTFGRYPKEDPRNDREREILQRAMEKFKGETWLFCLAPYNFHFVTGYQCRRLHLEHMVPSQIFLYFLLCIYIYSLYIYMHHYITKWWDSIAVSGSPLCFQGNTLRTHWSFSLIWVVYIYI